MLYCVCKQSNHLRELTGLTLFLYIANTKLITFTMQGTQIFEAIETSTLCAQHKNGCGWSMICKTIKTHALRDTTYNYA